MRDYPHRLAVHAVAATGLRRLLMRIAGPRYDGLPYPSSLPVLASSNCSRNAVIRRYSAAGFKLS